MTEIDPALNVLHEPIVAPEPEDIVLPFDPPAFLADTAHRFVTVLDGMDSNLAKRAKDAVDRDSDEHDYSPSIPVRGFLKGRMALRTAASGVLMAAKAARLHTVESNFVFHASGVYTDHEITKGPLADAYARKIVTDYEAANLAV